MIHHLTFLNKNFVEKKNKSKLKAKNSEKLKLK